MLTASSNPLASCSRPLTVAPASHRSTSAPTRPESWVLHAYAQTRTPTLLPLQYAAPQSRTSRTPISELWPRHQSLRSNPSSTCPLSTSHHTHTDQNSSSVTAATPCSPRDAVYLQMTPSTAMLVSMPPPWPSWVYTIHAMLITWSPTTLRQLVSQHSLISNLVLLTLDLTYN